MIQTYKDFLVKIYGAETKLSFAVALSLLILWSFIAGAHLGMGGYGWWLLDIPMILSFTFLVKENYDNQQKKMVKII